jgi:hypothetical protein
MAEAFSTGVLNNTAEEILAELFKTGTSEGRVEIDTLKERVDFDGCLGSRRRTAWGVDERSIVIK